MRTSRFLVILLLIGAVLPQQVIAEPAPGYRFPAHPVMMHLSVASNGGLALIAITVSEYGKPVEHMCPIDSPDTYIGCRELSGRKYLLFEVGDGVKYVNLTDSLAGFNFTALSAAPVGRKWFLVGARHISPCEFDVCTNVSYTVMEYLPEEERIGRPVRLSQIDSDVLFNLPDAMAVSGTISNGSLVFSFPYANETYSVPVEAFEEYLHLLNFSDSSGLNAESLLKLFRAVPFRGGLILYLPSYGIEAYTPEPYSLREYLLIGNRSSVYFPYMWVGHSGFVCSPNNASATPLTGRLFPPLLYYRNGRLSPLFNLSVEVPPSAFGNASETLTCPNPVLKLPNGTLARVGGNSFVPELELSPGEGRVYISIVRTVPHYSPENSTFVDFCVNREKILHAEFSDSSVQFLRMPFPGLFMNVNGSWVYGRLSDRGFRNFCVYYWGPAFNETFVYDPAGRTLRPIEESTVEYGSSNEFHAWKANQSAVSFITPSFDISRIPLENLSRCVPSSRAASMLRGVKVGEGILFYYPFYVTGIALEGRGWATVWGDYSSNARTTFDGTCLAFYYSDGRITSALKAETAVVAVPVGNWSVKLVIPYIDTGNALNVSPEPPEENTPAQTLPAEEGSGVCGPAAIIGFSVIPLLLRKKRRG
ncbi:hypothetical protein GQS_09990 [Thermococcus sp. 4557]|uniref:CGP-CTERM sorting domain-containing protein n=1 Tax=Thermococcus sp. (strain CGMCC 1.5172 / 4557) TaxID=1042877 RepID=UPI000219E9E5|nr:CGP-CTERM sorting domain-containing protein [Thermococcus sp. 4557]AEK73891.1 hypothetical protein GQS_09990 [Thermococcus sp. 4557]